MAIPLQPQPQPMSDLNTTPLIDVLLVLLIMFIITMPMQTHSVKIDLPSQPKPVQIQTDPVRNRITINDAGIIAWNGQSVDRATLRSLLTQSMAMPVEPALDLQPTAAARYEVVDAVMTDIKRMGVTKLGLPGNDAYGAF
jgi:biopolymer transport protein ExbD